ncbi:gluconate 2-dehydrogenase subunit 3 family protein [Membranihabitans marinus]|uniref:gluconate 2-dehydrogenase subunit 3 family protein n=1 Tax=Membranihabitans marinus TaxID=1227546 RepID=UPI001F280C96|nr:gluconate 2-dehydrogenase subunit 3 family protein [Membranihabitans marinus]
MDRRQVLQQTAKILGIGYLAPGVFIALQSCENKDVNDDWKPAVLSQQQLDILTATADTIVPKTTTPSATEVKVHEFIDLILSDVLSDQEVDKVMRALSDIEAISISKAGKSLSKLNDEDKTTVIGGIDQAAYGNTSQDKKSMDYKYLKSLILLSYYSSEQGVKQNLDFLPLPGNYQACIDISSNPTITIGLHL